MTSVSNSQKLFLVSFIIINLIIFGKAISIPIFWQQGEITNHHFYWSKEEPHDQSNSLKSGLHFSDFLKIFSSEYIEGAFRTRHLSYLFEMLSFKLWQHLEIIAFKDYSLILLHIINVILLFLLTQRLTKNNLTALLSAALALNSGVAMATLLFPFRTAKLLLITLFNLGWLLIMSSEGKFLQSSNRKINLFFIIFLLALFTDEIAFFLFPILFFYILLTERFSKRNVLLIFRKTLLTLSFFFLSAIIFYIFDAHLGNGVTSWPIAYHMGTFLISINKGWFIFDIMTAFTTYFLRKNFGYWDFTFWGIASCLSFGYLLFYSVRRKQDYLLNRIVGIIFTFIFLKALLFTHPRGYHWGIMPSNKIFPTILFFPYYYSYCESLLVSLSLGLLLNQAN